MKNSTTRSFYQPKDMEKVISATGTELYMGTFNIGGKDNFRAMGFSGKKAKYDFYINFHSMDSRTDYVNKWEKNILDRKMFMIKRAEEKKQAKYELLKNIKIGDLYYSSWGYEQTNVDFYQVTALKGKTITFKEIMGKTVEGSTYPHGMADERVAVKDAFLDETKYPPVVTRTLKLNSYSWLSPTTETEKHYCSWYA